MFAAKFVFRQYHEDEEFERLNDAILEAAESNPGYRGREKWHNGDGDIAVVYYWDTQEHLRSFARAPVHREAKARCERWYEGYRVEISRVIRTYGDAFYVTSGENGARDGADRARPNQPGDGNR